MTDEHRHADTSGNHLHLGVEDLLGLHDHFPFFLGRSIVQKRVDMGNDVEGNLLGELARLGAVADEDVARLFKQLIHPLFARARNGLIGGDHNARDRRGIMQRLERHNQLRGRAIGVGDDVLPAVPINGIRVHFRHDQRHIRIHAIERAIVDHDAAGGGGLRRINGRCI